MAERHRMHASGELDGEDLLCCNTALLPVNMSSGYRPLLNCSLPNIS